MRRLGDVLAFRFLRIGGFDLAPVVALLVLAWRWQGLASQRVAGIPLVALWACLLLGAMSGAVAVRMLDGPQRQDRVRSNAAVALVALAFACLGGLGSRYGFHIHLAEAAFVGVALAASAPFAAFIARRPEQFPWMSAVLVFSVLGLWAVRDMQFVLAGFSNWDLLVYLDAASRWLHGGSPYLAHALTRYPRTPAEDFFLYPPPVVPPFALLSTLPIRLVTTVWPLAMFAAAVAAFRLLGLAWGWAVLLSASPMLMSGVQSGNVANVTFLLFALAFASGVPLVLNALLKVQDGVAAAWLVRERRWRDLLIGVAAIAALALVTLPFTGFGSWRQWVVALEYRTQTQANLPGFYAESLGRWLPGIVFIAVGLVAVAASALVAGRRGLSAFGIAQVVVSPSLWAHEFSLALPALLTLESGTLLWLVLGLAADFGDWIWLIPVAGALALALSPSRVIDDPIHPLYGTDGPWRNPASPRARAVADSRPLAAAGGATRGTQDLPIN